KCSNPFCGLEALYFPTRLRALRLPVPDAVGFCDEDECEYDYRGFQCTRCCWKRLLDADQGELYEMCCIRCGKPLGEEDKVTVLFDTSLAAGNSGPTTPRSAWEELGSKAVQNGDVRS